MIDKQTTEIFINHLLVFFHLFSSRVGLHASFTSLKFLQVQDKTMSWTGNFKEPTFSLKTNYLAKPLGCPDKSSESAQTKSRLESSLQLTGEAWSTIKHVNYIFQWLLGDNYDVTRKNHLSQKSTQK